MKILFINPPNSPFTDTSILIEPIDILNLASLVKDKNEVIFYDMDNKREKPEALEKKKLDFDLAIIIYDNHIPLHKDNALDGIKDIAKILKDKGITTLLIGKLVTYRPEIIIELGIDYGIIGGNNIEGTLLNFVENNMNYQNIRGIVRNLNGKLIKSSPSEEVFDINKLGIADRELIDIKDYIDVRSIITSRGCANNCTFCPCKNYWGNWRARKAEKVVDEIEYLTTKFNSEKIIFLDDNATINGQRMIDISSMLIERKINVKLGCLSSINTYDKEMFKIMSKAGFRWVHFGIESGSSEVRERYNKYFDTERAVTIINELKALGFRVRISIIFDLMPVTEENLDKTIEFILRTQPHEIRLHYLVSRLGSNLNNNDDIDSVQYIHENDVVLSAEKDLSLLKNKRKELEDKLSIQGYHIVKSVDEWNDLKDVKDLKFLSYCPSRYGIGW